MYWPLLVGKCPRWVHPDRADGPREPGLAGIWALPSESRIFEPTFFQRSSSLEAARSYGPTWTRTRAWLIMSQLLYQLSYRPKAVHAKRPSEQVCSVARNYTQGSPRCKPCKWISEGVSWSTSLWLDHGRRICENPKGGPQEARDGSRHRRRYGVGRWISSLVSGVPSSPAEKMTKWRASTC